MTQRQSCAWLTRKSVYCITCYFSVCFSAAITNYWMTLRVRPWGSPWHDFHLVSALQRLIRHLPYEGRRQRQRLWTNLITAFKIFTGLLVVDPNLFFLPPTRWGLSGHSYNVLQGKRHRQRRESDFSVRVVKYWNKFLASVVTAPSVNIF